MQQTQPMAVLIDGAFFLKRYFSLMDQSGLHQPDQVAKNLYQFALKHLRKEFHLYRIFYYDCIPLDKKVHHPISKRAIDFKKTEQYRFRISLFDELKKKRKVALRLGVVKDTGKWLIYPNTGKLLMNGTISVHNLSENDVYYDIKQKGIDMKIGVDIASLALKRFVKQIVLISGDADFVPASKLARREGIDFILDPMWNKIDDSLFEHIDGLRSTCPKPRGV